MPELPEVETVVRALDPKLVGKRFLGQTVYQGKLREKVAEIKHLIGKPVLKVSRRSKYILVHFETGTLIIHLGMTGVLHWATNERGKHDHVDFLFADECGETEILRYTDPRRFGMILWQEGSSPHRLLTHLGPEPLEQWDVNAFYNSIKHRKVDIKKLIMDNRLVVGVGNIYASESLFQARIHPQTPGDRLSKKQAARLHAEIIHALEKGILHQGASIRNYRHTDGSKGEMSLHLHVYGRKGKPCDVCQTAIESVILGGRNTFYCPKCQKRPKSNHSKSKSTQQTQPL